MRDHRFGQAIVVMTGLLLCVFIAAGPAVAVSYTISDLGTLPGATTSSAADINNAGQIVGDSGGHGYLWQGGVMQSLGALPGAGSSTARSLNDVGQVVGGSGSHAFLWQGGTMQNLGTLPGAGASIANGINNVGQVVGNSGSNAFLWQGGIMQSLATPSGHAGPMANSINNFGEIAGSAAWTCGVNCGGSHGVIWQGGTPGTYTVLGGHEEFTRASRINDFAEIVGTTNQTEPFERVAGYIRPGSGPQTTFQFSSANGLNNLGQVVGNNSHGPGPMGAFFWSSETGMEPLSILNGTGWSGIDPLDINDHGWIVGTGLVNGATRGFLLTPFLDGGGAAAPEPGTLLLLGSGLAWLWRRERSRG